MGYWGGVFSDAQRLERPSHLYYTYPLATTRNIHIVISFLSHHSWYTRTFQAYTVGRITLKASTALFRYRKVQTLYVRYRKSWSNGLEEKRPNESLAWCDQMVSVLQLGGGSFETASAEETSRSARVRVCRKGIHDGIWSMDQIKPKAVRWFEQQKLVLLRSITVGPLSTPHLRWSTTTIKRSSLPSEDCEKPRFSNQKGILSSHIR